MSPTKSPPKPDFFAMSQRNSSHQLLSVPTEIISTIAFHLSLSPTLIGPPSSLIPFLLSCKRINSALSFKNNPRLYAELFEVSFDLKAGKRRYKEENQEGRMKARGLAEEFKKRCEGLKRLRKLVEKKNVEELREEDAWMLYMMLIENDGKNIRHLVNTTSHSTQSSLLPTLLKLYHSQDLVLKTLQSGYPSTSITRTLLIWIYWFQTTTTSIQNTDLSELEEFVFVLRPYVFAAKQYDICFAPWTLSSTSLPLGESGLSGLEGATNHPLLDPWRANLRPDSRLSVINHYGRRLEICPPILSLAANLNFFARVDQIAGVGVGVGEGRDRGDDEVFGGGSGTENAGIFLNGQPVAPVTPTTPTHLSTSTSTSSLQNPPATTTTSSATTALIPYRPPTNRRHVVFSPIRDSRIHDRDYKRLISCWDPRKSQGMDVRDWVGSLEGCWEGNFSFFDFESYRNMLISGARSLYEGQYGEQTQVWRMNEIYVRPRRRDTSDGNGGISDTPPPPSPSSISSTSKAQPPPPPPPAIPDSPSTSASNTATATSASVLNAGFPAGSSAFDDLMKHAGTRFQASNITSYIVDMMEGEKKHELMLSMLSGMEEKEVISKEQMREMLRRGDDVEASGGSGGVRGLEESEERSNREKELNEVEIMLVGTGHSAWGEFIVRGRVRLWDGLITLVKEYSPENRGRWLYRGYIVAGGVFVGRWRDCVTPAHLVGYEGTFSMARREDREEVGGGVATEENGSQTAAASVLTAGEEVAGLL